MVMLSSTMKTQRIVIVSPKRTFSVVCTRCHLCESQPARYSVDSSPSSQKLWWSVEAKNLSETFSPRDGQHEIASRSITWHGGNCANKNISTKSIITSNRRRHERVIWIGCECSELSTLYRHDCFPWCASTWSWAPLFVGIPKFRDPTDKRPWSLGRFCSKSFSGELPSAGASSQSSRDICSWASRSFIKATLYSALFHMGCSTSRVVFCSNSKSNSRNALVRCNLHYINCKLPGRDCWIFDRHRWPRKFEISNVSTGGNQG